MAEKDCSENNTNHCAGRKQPPCSVFAGMRPAVVAGRPDGRVIIAGPCSAESRDQVLETAKGLKDVGIDIFRAGIWKPRTRPGGFEGCGERGLQWVREVKNITGLPVATEVATAAHVEAALDAGVDLLWIGARTTVNPFAVQEIADCIKEKGGDVAILVKNPANPDVDLWIGAMQRLYNAGGRRIGAVHRGFCVYGNNSFRNPPQWHVPIELRRRMPDLQILCDPSHIGGDVALVAPLAQQACDLGFDGLMIESHCSPQAALSDAAQQLTPVQLAGLIASLPVKNVGGVSADLMVLRAEIDRLDEELLAVLEKRMSLADEIGRRKQAFNMPVLQPERYGKMMDSRVQKAMELGLNRDFVASLFSAIHAESVSRQLKLK